MENGAGVPVKIGSDARASIVTHSIYTSPIPRDTPVAWPEWSDFGLVDDIRPALATAVAQGQVTAIATLFHSQGGSPRGPGAQMLVGHDILVGHISGGCIESDVVNHCRRVIASGEPKRLVYGYGGPWDLPLPCGGRIELLIEKITPDDVAVASLLDFESQRHPCLWTSDGWSRRCEAFSDAGPLAEAGFENGMVYRHHDPRPRLVVVGSDPPALAIAQLAATMGMEAILVRPNGPSQLPPLAGVTYRRERCKDALAAIGLDRWTAVAACTHDQDLDGETLAIALQSSAFYIGALGSARRRPEREAALRAAGLDSDSIARLTTPIGLTIGARTPWEIAVATLSDVVGTLRGQASRPGIAKVRS